MIGDPATASARLQFCQSWNGVASFIGPLIASKFFFTGANATSLTNVQFVYLAVSIAGVAVAVLFFFSKLPEVSESALNGGGDVESPFASDEKPLKKQYNMWFGFLAQFCYVGAQVTVASFFINYATELPIAKFTSAESSNLLSYALIIFTVGRFAGTGLATVFASDFIMIVFASACIVLNVMSVVLKDRSGVGCVMALFFFEAPMYPILFTLGTENLGSHTRRGAGILVMSVSGGACKLTILHPQTGFLLTVHSVPSDTGCALRCDQHAPLVRCSSRRICLRARLCDFPLRQQRHAHLAGQNGHSGTDPGTGG